MGHKLYVCLEIQQWLALFAVVGKFVHCLQPSQTHTHTHTHVNMFLILIEFTKCQCTCIPKISIWYSGFEIQYTEYCHNLVYGIYRRLSQFSIQNIQKTVTVNMAWCCFHEEMLLSVIVIKTTDR
jgi:hypothetical protein